MRSGDAIQLPVTLAIVRQVCEALDYAHGLRDAAGQWLGIVHRDVSPINIWVNETGRATLVASAAAQASHGYMAPEYVMTGTLDWRADLFAVGVLAYELLTNRPLFTASSERETMDRVCTLQILPPSSLNPNLPPEIDAIVMPALARDPAHRWQYAAMIRDQIQGLAQRHGLDAAAMNPALWTDLITPRHDPAPPPQRDSPPPVVPPPASRPAPGEPSPENHPRVWAEAIDDGDGATRIEPMDPSMLVGFRPAAGKRAAARPTPAPQTPVAPSPIAEEAPLVDRELGPEPTHVGAMPLISFGDDAPLTSSIGDKSRLSPRTSAPSIGPPVGTFLRVPTAPVMAGAKRLTMIVGIIVAALVLLVIVLGIL